MDGSDLHWLAGLLEGEGAFLRGSPSCPNRPRVTLQMTDEDVIERAAVLMDTGYVRKYEKRGRWKDTYVVSVSGKKAVRLMEKLRPLMGSRRKAQIDAALSCFVETRVLLFDEDIEAIRSEAASSGLTQRELARKFGIRRETVNKVVNRKGRYK